MRRPPLTWASLVVFALLGLFVNDSRATFLVQVTATLNTTATSTGARTSITLANNNGNTTGNPVDVTLGTLPIPQTVTFGTATTAGRGVNPAGDSYNFAYDWTVTLLEIGGAGASTTIDVSGTIGGSMSISSTNLTNTFNGSTPVTYTPVVLDGQAFVFKVNDPGFVSGGPPPTTNNFSVSLAVPEPSTMVLLGLGMGVVALAPRVRRLARTQQS